MLSNAPLSDEERARLQRPIVLAWTWEKWATIGGILDAMEDVHRAHGRNDLADKVQRLATEFFDLYRQALKQEHEEDQDGTENRGQLPS